MPKSTIVATPVPVVKRLNFLPELFGPKLMMRAEGLLYSYAGSLTSDYQGGLWEYYKLSNGGGYAAPTSPERMTISVHGNGFEGEMSCDAAGVVISLFVLNQLTWECQGKNDELMEKLSDHYYQLRDFAGDHAEAKLIFRAID